MTPNQLVALLVAAFVVPVIGIVLVLKMVLSDENNHATDAKKEQAAILARIQPVGQVDIVDPNAPKRGGEEVYNQFCVSCHGSGAAGAPKLGDVAAWAKRIAKGQDGLIKSGLAGMPNTVMAAKGGADVDDEEFANAVIFLANKSGAKFTETKQAAPAAASAPAAATTTAAATPAAPAAAPADTKPADVKVDGAAVYASSCAMCHTAGIAGAPKLGDKAGWAARVAQGKPTLYQHAIKGFQGKAGMMPAKGGNMSLSDAQVQAAVDHLLAAVK